MVGRAFRSASLCIIVVYKAFSFAKSRTGCLITNKDMVCRSNKYLFKAALSLVCKPDRKIFAAAIRQVDLFNNTFETERL